jgi:hypothetical protein
VRNGLTTDLRVIQQRPGKVNILVTLNAENELEGVAGTMNREKGKGTEGCGVAIRPDLYKLSAR